jgi:hypothetical protein
MYDSPARGLQYRDAQGGNSLYACANKVLEAVRVHICNSAGGAKASVVRPGSRLAGSNVPCNFKVSILHHCH